MTQNTFLVAATMAWNIVLFLVAVSEAAPLSQTDGHMYTPAKNPFAREKLPSLPWLNQQRPHVVTRPERGSLEGNPPRDQQKPEPVFNGDRDDVVQRPKIIYIKNSMNHEPNGRPQLPHVEGVRRRYRFDDIPDFRQGQWWNERPQISQEYERHMEREKTSTERPGLTSSLKPVVERFSAPQTPLRDTKLSYSSRRQTSCLYSGRRFEHSTLVKTPEPCLNCTCQAGVLVCHLRVCPAVLTVPEGCFAAREPGQCCATTICNIAPDGESSDKVNSLEKISEGENDEDGATEATKERYTTSGEITANPLVQPVADGTQTDFVLDEHAVTLIPEQSFQTGVSDSPTSVTSSPSGKTSFKPEQFETATRTGFLRGACVLEGRSYRLGAVLPSEACKRCLCTQKGIRCATVKCPSVAAGCTGLTPQGHCCPTEYVCEKFRNTKNETGQLKIIPDPRPGSFKETHVLRKIDGDSFETYLMTTVAPADTPGLDRASKVEALAQKTLATQNPDKKPTDQVIIDTDGVNLTSDESASLFYIPETLLESTTSRPASAAPWTTAEAAATEAPTTDARTSDSENRSQHELILARLERPKVPGSSLDPPQNYLQPVYVPEDRMKELNEVQGSSEQKPQTSGSAGDSGEPTAIDPSGLLEAVEKAASTTVSTYATLPDIDTKLSKYSNNNGKNNDSNNNNNKKKSTFTVNLGSHITVAFDPAEVTTEDGITTAKNSEFTRQAEATGAPFWKKTTASTTELPRPWPHIFTLQEKQDRVTPTESSVTKLTRKQGDEITTIPGLIISTPSGLLRSGEPATTVAKPPSSSEPSYIITTSDVINNEVKFHAATTTGFPLRPTSPEAFSTEYNELRKTDVEPQVQSSPFSEGIHGTAASSAITLPTKAPTLTHTTTGTTTKAAIAAAPADGNANKAQLAGLGALLKKEDFERKIDAQQPAANIDFAEGIKIFSTLLLSGLAQSRSDQPPTASSNIFHDDVTGKTAGLSQYSSTTPIPVTRNPLQDGRSYTAPSVASSQFFTSNVPPTFSANGNPSKVATPQTSTIPPTNRSPFSWPASAKQQGETSVNKTSNFPQSVVSFVASDALFTPQGHFLANGDGVPTQGSDCFINGVTTADGGVISKADPCMLCRCHRGEEFCIIRQCPAPPSVDCVQQFIDGLCCPRYKCKPDSVRLPARDSHRRVVDDGFHQPNHPNYVPHIDIMIASQNPQLSARTIDRPNSKQEYIALEGVRRPSSPKKKLPDSQGEKRRTGFSANEKAYDQLRTKGSSADSEFTTIPTATLKVLLQHATNSFPTSAVTLSSTTDRPVVNTESPFARSLFKAISEKGSATRSNNVHFASLSSTKPSPTLQDFISEKRSQSASTSIWNLLKVSACNIYGKYYQVNEIVTELTERCKLCTCTGIGVHCVDTC